MSNNKEISGQSSWDPILLRYDYTFGDFYVGQKFFNETVPVIPIDTDGLQWILIDSVGFHPTNGFHRNPSNNISAFSDVHLTSDTLSRHDFRLSHFRWKVSGIDFCLFNWKKKSFPSESLGVYWTYMTVFVYFPHCMLQTQDWDSAAFSTTCLQSMPTAVNVSHELSLKSSQKYFTYVLLTLSRLAKTNPWPVSSAGHRNAREVLSYLSSSEDLLIIRKIIVALFKFCSEFF